MKSYIGGQVTAVFRRYFCFTSTLGQNRVPEVADIIPNGYLAVYVGEDKKRRFVIPVAYVNHPSFQGMLKKAEEEFGFSPPWGGLTLPCHEDIFVQVTSCLDAEFSKK